MEQPTAVSTVSLESGAGHFPSNERVHDIQQVITNTTLYPEDADTIKHQDCYLRKVSRSLKLRSKEPRLLHSIYNTCVGYPNQNFQSLVNKPVCRS